MQKKVFSLALLLSLSLLAMQLDAMSDDSKGKAKQAINQQRGNAPQGAEDRLKVIEDRLKAIEDLARKQKKTAKKLETSLQVLSYDKNKQADHACCGHVCCEDTLEKLRQSEKEKLHQSEEWALGLFP